MSDKTNPTGSTNFTTVDLLPKYYQTSDNKKFIQATIDQLVQKGTAKKVNGYVGRENAKSANGNDIYIKAANAVRKNYQLEPAVVVSDVNDNVEFFKDYQDYINQLKVFGSNVDNHERINRQEFYSWDPHIDWDKFVNFQQYYWLPYGPDLIKIAGQQLAVESTLKVEIQLSATNQKEYLFTPNGVETNPAVTMYRGQTYYIDVNSPGEPFSIKTSRAPDTLDRYTDNGYVDKFGVTKGTIKFVVPVDAPDILYYVSERNPDLGGIIKFLDVTENSYINVDADILGKKTYTLADGTPLSNGMKVSFLGNVLPESYATGEYYVEGVGTAIKLMPTTIFEIISSYTSDVSVAFDATLFDQYPFAAADSFAGNPDYITINRASKDRNPWSRYNRWFHKDTIAASAKFNDKLTAYDQGTRAARPIIEFEADLQLFNFGSIATKDVDLVDSYTTDVFSSIEGTAGYNIDGVQLTENMRVLFVADNDILVKNNIYKVTFVNIANNGIGVPQIRLIVDETPAENTTTIVRQGTKYQGSSFWFNGTTWTASQAKTIVNQSPLFDLYDSEKNSFSTYSGSTFKGTQIFSYKVGTTTADPVLGFALSYQNINNIGDILFTFNLLTDTFQYKTADTLTTKVVNTGYLARLSYNNSVEYKNGWQTSLVTRYQPAVRVYKNSQLTNNFPIDIYDNKANLSDLEVRVFVNGVRLDPDYWTIIDAPSYKLVKLDTDVKLTDVLTIKSFASQPINENGYYELPINFQNNPLNADMVNFTLGEVTDHVNSIIDNVISEFDGQVTGSNNIRDLGNITPYGTKFVQHSGPASLAVYHITSEQNNIVKAIEASRDDYGKFKRNFLLQAFQLGEDTDVISQVDLILEKLTANKSQTSPYYFSDMVPWGGKKVTSYTVVDSTPLLTSYPLSQVFDNTILTSKAVSIYIDSEQLLYRHDYTFTADGYVNIVRPLVINQVITVFEYDSTDGSYIPSTPTKLGLWPKFEPKIYTDTSLLTPRLMIQGHDGSQTVAYGDYRDELILELEKRIYNNIQVEYDPDIFDIHSIIPGYYRNNDYSLAEFNTALAPSFYKWISLAGQDFSKAVGYDPANSLTFNYKGHSAPDGRELPGYWRGIYRWVYDTDRPNLCPWEMLGFSEEPNWWQTAYGPAPYTDNNIIMWEDLSQGAVKEPGKPVVYRPEFARPTLLNHIPVDSNGEITSPNASSLSTGVFTSDAQSGYVFGDVGPTESAWRRSSYYPFSALIASMLLKPAYTFATCLDRSRTVRNLCGQLVYAPTKLRVKPSDIILPSIYTSSTRVLTSGILNYLVEKLTSSNTGYYSAYQYNLDNISIKLSYRLAGFTSKDNYNLILDSKNPASTGNVFIPQENYKIVYNNSSPIKKLSYSGIIITKLQDGYEVKGYSLVDSYFRFHPALQGVGSSVNVGGISAPFVTWSANRTYSVGQIIYYNGKYYRTKYNTISTEQFDGSAFEALSELPITGGVSAIFRKVWDTDTVLTLPYNSVLPTVQDVVDFLLGYGAYLKTQGFIFDEFNANLASVTNWETSAKEFMFWTTQSWSTGADKWQDWSPNQDIAYGSVVKYNGDYYRAVQNSVANPIFVQEDFVKLDGLSTVGSAVISISPAANSLTFASVLSVADDISNPFNDYEIFNVDGTGVQPSDLNSTRQGNIVTYTPAEGSTIYSASFYLVQKEQVIILDNTTVFNDVLYNPESGYRQERIKVSGFVSSEWFGGFEVPGFIYDRADIKQWQQWTDYALGDIVQYQGFYYSATSFIAGTGDFNANSWTQITKPTPKLLPNWTYKAGQFEDFYDLDNSSFDTGQQSIAQHLIGYQPRQYLSNIIQDEVSEFQFYQGMIREKGTQNSLNKLFDVLSAADKESLSFYEEWAIRVGQYGASQAFEAVEFVIDQTSITDSPQGFYLSNDDTFDSSFNIKVTPNQVYLKPVGYNSNPWPKNNKQKPFLRTAGYVQAADDTVQIKTIDDITSLNIANFKEGAYVWVAFEKTSWNIYRFTSTNMEVANISKSGETLTVTLVNQADPALLGEYIGITPFAFAGFYKVISVSLNSFTVEAKNIPTSDFPSVENIIAQTEIFRLYSVRASSIDDANNIIKSYTNVYDKIWVDKDQNDKWASLQLQSVYSQGEITKPYPVPDMEHGRAVVMDKESKIAVVSTKVGQAITYERQGKRWIFKQIIKMPFMAQYEFQQDPNSADVFAETLAISSDGEYLAVGSPRAGRLATIKLPNGNIVCDKSGSNSSNLAMGAVSLYQRSEYNEYNLLFTIASGDGTANQQFGSSLVFGTNTLFIGSKGATNYGTQATVFELRFVANSGTDTVVSNLNADAGDANAVVTVTYDGGNATTTYNAINDTTFDGGLALNINSTADRWLLTRPGISIINGSASGFGSAITVSEDNTILAISAPNVGSVHIYKLSSDDTYRPFQTLNGPTKVLTTPTNVDGVVYFDNQTLNGGVGFKQSTNSLYNNVVQYIQTTGGTGTGLVVDAIVNASGVVTKTSVRDPGNNYTVGDLITLINPVGSNAVSSFDLAQLANTSFAGSTTDVITATTGQSGINLKAKVITKTTPGAVTGDIVIPVKTVDGFEIGDELFSSTVPSAFASGTTIAEVNRLEFTGTVDSNVLTVTSIESGTDNITATITGSIEGTTLYIDQIAGQPLVPGMNLSGISVADKTQLVSKISDTSWLVSDTQEVPKDTVITAVLPGRFKVGMYVANPVLDGPTTFNATIKAAGTAVLKGATATLIGGTSIMYNATINGILLTISTNGYSAEPLPGMTLTGSGITAGTKILYGSGLQWVVDTSQTVSATNITGTLLSATINGTTLSFQDSTGVAIESGMVLTGGTVTAGTKILYGSGTTWYVDIEQTSTCSTATIPYASIDGNTLTFVSKTGSDVEIGMVLTGGSVQPGTVITSATANPLVWLVSTNQQSTCETATAQTSFIDAVINGTVLTFASSSGATLQVGMVLTGGTVAVNTYIQSAGPDEFTWNVNISQTSTCTTATSVILTVTGPVVGTIRLGQTMSGGSITNPTTIVATQTGEGGTGTYFVSPIQNVASVTAASAGYIQPNIYINAFGTGTGGVGTYILSQTPAGTPTVGTSIVINKPLADTLSGNAEITTIKVQDAGSNFFVGDTITFDIGPRNATTQVTSTTSNASIRIAEVGDGSYTKDATQFGTSISISQYGEYLAIGSPFHSKDQEYQGQVAIYTNNLIAGNTYSLYQNITSPYSEQGNLFGSKVQFTKDYKSLVVFSPDASNLTSTLIDSNGTTFDYGSLEFKEIMQKSGRVDIYDRYNKFWIAGESLGSTNKASDGFGQAFAVSNNTILVGAAHEVDFVTDAKTKTTISDINAGKVYSYDKTPGTYSWTPIHTQTDLVDLTKIKQAFLYNRVSNKLITYLDIIDPTIGRIAGIADQELSFKTFYDPAIYSVGNGSVNSDVGTAWLEKQVGKLWWDLRTAKFIDSHATDITYRNSTMNMLANGASIDVYEWVETKLTPTEWASRADTATGLTQGVSGQPLYTDAYSVKQTFDIFSKTFKNTYYFWVKNKSLIPSISGRLIAASEVSQLIANPNGVGHAFVALTGTNSFSLINCQKHLTAGDVVLGVEYWLVENTTQNIHAQWKLVDNNPTTQLPPSIEEKWFDSLCGKDQADRPVPDLNLPPKLRYGIESRPRQGMFVNNYEALKQFVESVNLILAKEQIVEQKNISALESFDTAPNLFTGEYDLAIDTDAELRLVPVSTAKSAVVAPVIENGSIVGITIINAGSGYKTSPQIVIRGVGKGAKVKLEINIAGQITGAVISNGGKGYTDTTTIEIRPFSVLTRSDSYANGNWSIYSYDPATKTWTRIKTQSYDVRNYWSYADWYATGYNQFTVIDYAISTFAELGELDTSIGQIVKIRTAGSYGWQLLVCYSKSSGIDWTERYKVVGIENGTMQLSSNLYSFQNNNIGFDGSIYDSIGFDYTASKELRVILNCLKDEILTDTLRREYLNLFFASVRYAHTEQTYIDWAFKTSFVKAQHNVGSLKQTVTYQNDNLPNFQDYINEVVPYRTTVREYVSNYNTTDNSKSVVTDFDLPAIFRPGTNDIIKTSVVDGKIVADDITINSYPWKNWLDQVGFKVTSIVITEQGSGYVTPPTVRIVSNSGSGATAKAFIANGKVNRILLVTQGSGYLAAPTIVIDGGGTSSGKSAKAIAIIGSSVVRSSLIKMKFDRTTSKYYTIQLNETESFVGTGNRTNFALTWAPDVKIGNSSVKVNGVSLLRDDYTLTISKSTAKGYTSYSGIISFKTAPIINSTITVDYLKDISLLNASDRIQYFYDPVTGQLGKDLGQLMTGVDYGGVIVTGVDYNVSQGWGSVGFMADPWDSYENTYNDYVVTIDANTASSYEFLLPYTPDVLSKINVYYAQVAREEFTSDGSQLIYQIGAGLNSLDVNATLVKSIVGATSEVTATSVDVVTITATIAGFNKFKGPTAGLTIGKPVEFISPIEDLFGNVVPGTTYYVKDIYDTEGAFTVSRAIGAESFTLTTASGSMQMKYLSSSNYLTGNTSTLTVGGAIQFTGTVFGGVQTNKTYFVKQIISSTNFTIATSLNGSVVPLTSAEGSMNLRAVAGTGSLSLKLNDTNGLKVGDTLSVSVAGAVAEGTVISKINNFGEITINNILYGSLLAGTQVTFTRTLTTPADYRFLTNVTIQLNQAIYIGGTITITSPLDPIRIDDENFTKIWIITYTNSNTNEITTITPITFKTGDVISFTGTTFGNIQAGTNYYVHSVTSNGTFKISFTDGGTPVVLKTASGSMTATSTSNPNAVMATYIADGTEPKVFIPRTFNLPLGDLMIFRKSTSDGSVTVSDNDIDTALDGGSLVYNTATGISADDIILDGDGYVTSTSSPAPEEVVPGQVVDAVSIKVYDRPTDGSATVKTLSYIADGVNKEYDLEQFPNSKQAVFVKLNNTVLTLGTDYFIDYPRKRVRLNVLPNAGNIVTVHSFGFNGTGVLDVDYFVADGKTKEFITKAPYIDTEFTYVVYLDGVPITPTLFKTDTTYESSNRIGFRFSIAPTKFSVLNYLIVAGAQQTYAIFKNEKIATDGSYTYQLSNTIGSSLPLESNIIVRANQEILKGPNTSYFTIGSNKYTYELDTLSVQPYSINTQDVEVYADGMLLALSTDYSIDTSVVSISINRKVYSTYKGKELIVKIVGTQDYTISGSSITFKDAYTANDYVEVISAYKHDILQIQRKRTTATNNLTFTSESPTYYRYTGVLGGLIELGTTITTNEQLLVTKNKLLLTKGVDYIVTESLNSIKLDQAPAINDQFELIIFAGTPVQPGLAYMQFKDILNRTVYKRLSALKQNSLAQDLHYYDSTIVVKDAGNFDKPNPVLNKPGIIEINGERIEYFTIKNNTTLGQLRRGTLGTGIPTVHGAGSRVQDIGPSETIPYADITKTEQVTIDGTTTEFVIPLSFTPSRTASAWSASPSNYKLFAGAEIQKFVSKTGTGPYVVTFAIPQQEYAPTTGKYLTVEGNTSAYNGNYAVSSSNITNKHNIKPTGINTSLVNGTALSVTFATPEQIEVPPANTYYIISGATPAEYNGAWLCTASSSISMTLHITTNYGPFTVLPDNIASTNTISLAYNTDPGTFNSKLITTISAPVYGQTDEIDVFVGGYDDSTVWTPNTVFEADQIVTINSYTYRMTAKHRSGNTFNSAVTTLDVDSAIIKTNVPATTVRTFFIGNIRLKKHPYSVYNVSNAPTSPEGDVDFVADFAVDGVNSELVLTNKLIPGTVVTIIRKQGKSWTENNETLQASNTKIAKFITEVPGVWVTGNKITSTTTSLPSTTASFDNVTKTFDGDNTTFDQGT